MIILCGNISLFLACLILLSSCTQVNPDQANATTSKRVENQAVEEEPEGKKPYAPELESDFYRRLFDSPYRRDHEPFTERGEEILNFLYESSEEVEICEGAYHYYLDEYYPAIYDLGDDEYIIDLQCAAAYNPIRRYFRYIENKEFRTLEPLRFEAYQQEEDGSWTSYYRDYVGGLRVYDPDERRLRVFGKGIASGTCGAYAEYVWDEESSTFELTEFRHKYECFEGFTPPEEFPLVYQRD
ncbi:MAG: hypothetical protein AAGG51_13470 [Cyanobacteria bacterium P01_G01_bin.54]